MSENKVTFGLEKVHIAFFDTENVTQPAWQTPEAIPGAVRWTPSPEGESNTFYADNGAYFTVVSNNGYTGELEMANLPDTVRAKMLGWEIDNNGMIVEVADAQPAKFALLGEVKGDKKNRKFVYYDCQAKRPSKENSTQTETTEPATDVVPLVVSPITVGDKKIVKGDIELSDTNATIFDGFYSAVLEPDFSTVT